MCIDNYYSYIYNTVCMCSTMQSYFSIYAMSFMQNSTYPLYHDVSMTRLLHLAIYTLIHWSPDYDHLRATKALRSLIANYVIYKFNHCILQPLPILYRRIVKLWMIMQTHAHSNVYKHQRRSRHMQNTFLGTHECTPDTHTTHTHTHTHTHTCTHT